jgi:DNA polymerase-3 subunit delta'
MRNTFYVAIKTEKIMALIQSCNLKFQNIILIYTLPYVTTEEVKKNQKYWFHYWLEQFIIKSPYGGLFDWYAILGVQNKQAKSEMTRKKF